MATFTTTQRTEYGTLAILVTEGAGDVSNNTSPISITIRYTSASQSYMGITDFDVTDSLGNALVSNYTRSYGIVKNISKGPVIIKTWSNLTAHHTEDGSGSLAIKISYQLHNRTSYTDNFTMELAAIARGSELSLAASSITIGDTSGSLGYTITSDGDYYHKVTATISNTRDVISGVEINNTTYNGTIPYSTILQCIPSSFSGTLTVKVYTYADAEMTVSRGSRTATCTVIVTLKPVVSNLTISSSLGSMGLVAGYSYGIISCATAKPEGASLVTTYINATNMSQASSISLTPSVNTPTFPASTSNSTITVSAYAIDSRGLRSEDVQITATVLGYTAPQIQCDFYRTSNSSGTPEADESGTYVYVDYDAIFTQLYGMTATVDATFNGNSIAPQSFSPLLETQTATIIVTAADNIASVTQEFTVPVAIFAIDVYDAGSGDTGIAFGGISRSGYNDSFLIGTGDYYYDSHNGNSAVLDGVTLMGIADSTSSVLVTVFLPKLLPSSPTVTATVDWIRGAGATKTPGSVSLDAYSANWVRLSVAGTSLTQYQTYAVHFTALSISL